MRHFAFQKAVSEQQRVITGVAVDCFVASQLNNFGDNTRGVPNMLKCIRAIVAMFCVWIVAAACGEELADGVVSELCIKST